MLDTIYDMRNNVFNAGYDVKKIDLGMTIPKLSASYARMNLKSEISKEHIEASYRLWFEAFEQALGYEELKMTTGDQKSISSLGSDAFKLYTYLEETYGVDTAIPKTALTEIKIMPQYMIEEAIERLLLRGYMYYPNTREFKLLSFS